MTAAVDQNTLSLELGEMVSISKYHETPHGIGIKLSKVSTYDWVVHF